MGCNTNEIAGHGLETSPSRTPPESLYLALEAGADGKPGGILITSFAQEIFPNLWIGGYKAYEDATFLKKNKIEAILTLGHFKEQYTTNEFMHKIIAIADNPEANILVHFPEAIEFIDGALDAGKRILVHCLAGVSRSPTIVSAYLMSKRHIHPKAALALIKQKRPFANPNPGFMDQLRLFREMNYMFDPSDPAYIAYHARHPIDAQHAGHEQEYTVTDALLNNKEEQK